jgi:hypothetical protein
VGDADERQQVVLADRVHREGAGQDELVVVALLVGEGGQLERAGGEQLGVGARHPSGRAPGALRIQRHPERGEELRRGGLGGGQVDAGVVGDHPQGRARAHPGSLHVEFR